MKTTISILTALILCIALLMGCAARVATIPPEPRIKQVMVYTLSDGALCIDNENAAILRENLQAMREYQKELLKILKEK